MTATLIAQLYAPGPAGRPATRRPRLKPVGRRARPRLKPDRRRADEYRVSALEIRTQLERLELELVQVGHVDVRPADLAGHLADLAALEDEIAAQRDAYVGTAVTEIASLRAELFGPQLG